MALSEHVLSGMLLTLTCTVLSERTDKQLMSFEQMLRNFEDCCAREQHPTR